MLSSHHKPDVSQFELWTRFFSKEDNVAVLSNRLKVKRDELTKHIKLGDELAIQEAQKYMKVGFEKLNHRFPDWDWPFNNW